MSTTIETTGTIVNADTTDIDIPVDLEIDKVMVFVGDEVKKDEVLATVNQNSLMAELMETQEDLDEINEDLSTEAEYDSVSYVTSSVTGRVKKIYAKKNKDVDDIILDKGALMLISMDGKMAADVETSVSLTTGQEDKVLLSDGTSVSGTVAGTGDKSCKVTISDSYGDYNESVTVKASDGTKIGTGKLYINKESKVMATAGTISSILVSVNESISKGESLLKLKGDFQSAEYVSLTREKEKLEEKMEILLAISAKGGIAAKFDGVVTAVNVSGNTVSAAEGTSGNADASTSMTKTSASADKSGGFMLTSAVVVTTTEALTEATTEYSADTGTEAVTEEATTEAGTEATTEAGTESTTETEATATTAAKTEDKTEAAVQSTTQAPEKESAQVKKTTGSTTVTAPGTSKAVTSSVSTSSSVNTSSSVANASDTQTNEELTTAFSVASGENMNVTVNVDEMDILSVTTGQTVELTFEAIENETFEGTVTSVNKSGTSGNGTTKYPVEITVAKTEKMVAGMNVSATIIVEETEDTLMIPAQAVMEEGNTSYVYTKKDESSGELSGKVEIETGNSNGTTVEVVSGLMEGDTVYYEVVGTSSSGEKGGMFFPGGGTAPDMSNMPGSGDMPYGGGRNGTGGEKPARNFGGESND